MKKIKFNIIPCLSIVLVLVILLFASSPSFSLDNMLIWEIYLQDWTEGSQDIVLIITQEASPYEIYHTTINSNNVDYFLYPVETSGSYYVKAKANHWLKHQVVIDPVPFGFSINDNDAYTKDPTVSLTFYGMQCLSSYFDEINISNDGATWNGWVTPSNSLSCELASGADGERTVYVKFKDTSSGKMSNACSDTIILDTTPPSIGTLTFPEYSTSSSINISYSGASDLSGIVNIELWYKKGMNGTWTDTSMNSSSTSHQFNFTATQNAYGTYYFDLVTEDVAGNTKTTPPAPNSTGVCSTIYFDSGDSCSFSSIITPPMPQ